MAWDTGFGYIGRGIGSLFEADGYRKSASGLREAAVMSDEAAKLSTFNTKVRATMAGREAYRVIGGQQADVAGAGFAASGTALDLLRSSQTEAALTDALVQFQGAIDTNQFSAQAASYRNQADQADSKAKGAGFGGFLNIALGIGSLLFSDRRLKTDIKAIGKADNGLTIYSFKMKGEPRTQLGFLADEVAKMFPGAVKDLGGENHFLLVDYEKATAHG